ncbi:MAG: Glutamate synthase (NADPH) small chain [Syntrophorhabdus sp. PtaB.Bin047]|jgi:NADPH-dependent glutamate synthase beta subunit-like oxidoreductase|nr:MAG: Glutamate synthase (NADPH) small chain [Syntrophorhabdus sp. PtaB.Bin047]
MDQQELRKREERCIEDEPPWCSAACPLHVDARAFIGHLARNDAAEALNVLHRTMPLPNILGRICDAPCETFCKRSQAGEAIRIGALERSCVCQDARPRKLFVLPPRGKRVAIGGSGLSSLAVAWDCLRKGYGVRIFEAGERPGEELALCHPDLLPRSVVDEEIAFLMKLGMEVETGAATHRPEFLERCLETFDAVYLGLDCLPGGAWGLERDDSGGIRVEPGTQRTSREGVFAGGLPREGRVSPVWQAAEGRFAANSIDRHIQRVSLTAGREKEGPSSTRLYTSIAGVIPLPAVKAADPLKGYSGEEALHEARRCLQCRCLECVKVCVYLERFGAYPRKYAREIYNNESIVMGAHQANRLINSCSLCGLCEAVCPEDFAMQDLCLEARRSMVERGKMPPSAHEFALEDMAVSLSDRFALARHEPGLETSALAFFPGCQLAGSQPDKVIAVYEYLRSALTGGVGLVLGCCAAPAWWAGSKARFDEGMEALRGQWNSLGSPKLILACSTCLQLLREHLPEVPAVSLWTVLDETGGPIPPGISCERHLVVHDPCTTRTEPGVQASVRHVLGRLGVRVGELELGRGKTECCGFGGLQQNANPEIARETARVRARRSEEDYLAYCAMCRDRLASAGKRVLHLLDLLFPDRQVPDPAVRKDPGWSQRQENRWRLKERLLKELWSEEEPPKRTGHGEIRLQIRPEVRRLLEERRILDEDLQRVIHHAESSGEKFRHPGTGRLKASFKPRKVTFWVEYERCAEGFVIHNAYSHRMEVTVS